MIIERHEYENPDPGLFIGVIVDVVELYDVPTRFGPRNKVRIVWILDKCDSQGKPYRVTLQANATLNEKSKLFDAISHILGAPPGARFDCESLIGRANQLFVERADVNGKDYANVMAIMPVPAGAAVPQIPARFVRSKDKSTTAPRMGVQTPPRAASPESVTSNVNFD